MNKLSLKNKKILITGGATWVALDDMRVISNKSSGVLSQILAKNLARKGAKVHLLEGTVEERLKSKAVKTTPFHYYKELETLLKKELLRKYDIIIHAAAVSDYQPKKKSTKKISSNLKTLSIDLIPTKKIINIIKRRSPQSLLVGFKLESGLTPKTLRKYTQKLFTQARCDYVVANTLKGKNYTGFLIDPSCKILQKALSREEMTSALTSVLSCRYNY